MKLEVELKPIKKFEVKINGKVIGEFEKTESWEGLSKLQGANGVIIIDDEKDFVSNIFKNLLADSNETSKHGVFKITPSLIPVPDKET